MQNSVKKNSIEKYLLFLVIFIEIGLIVYFSIFTKNVFQYTISLLLMILITFPLGFSVSILLFRQKSISEILILSLCVGLPLTAGVWGVLAYSTVPIYPVIYLGSVFFVSVILLIITRLKYKKIICQKSFNYTQICLPIVIFLIGFLWHALMQANNNVPFDCDPQSTIYIETLMKYQGYPSIKPFMSGDIANITHPPTFHILVVIPAIIRNTAMHKECMAITIICGAYFVLAVYLLAYYLSREKLFIGFFAGLLTLNRAYLTNYNDGNQSELFAFLCVTIFLLFILYAFREYKWSKSILLATIGGFVFAHAGLSQTEIFQWYSISLLFFTITYWWAKDRDFKKDISIIAVSLLVCGMVFLPWFLSSVKNFQEDSMWKITEKEATELILSLTYWHSYAILGLSLIGMVFLVLKRDKIGIFVVTHILVVFLLIIHWKIFKLIGFEWFELKPLPYNYLGARANFTSPFRFLYNFTIAWYALTIAFPIASSYSLELFNNLLQKSKIFKYQFKKFSVSLILIIIGISFFMYFEYKNYRRYPEWLLKSDYEALLWFHENTSYEDTLILNPTESIKLSNGASFLCSFWVPSVAERRAVNARGLGADHIPLSKDLMNKKSLLDEAFYNIQAPNVHELLKNNGVSHIFVSALLTGQLGEKYLKIPFLELVHYKQIPNLGTALIFRVKS